MAHCVGQQGTIKYTLQRTLPTMFFGVPRVWEKFQASVATQRIYLLTQPL